MLLFLLASIEMIYASDPTFNLRITKTTGTSDFELSTLQELKFSNGNLVINKVGNTSSSFTISDISDITFVNSSTADIQNSILEENLYHSLTDNLLSLHFANGIENPYKVTLYNSSGVVLSTQKWTVGSSISIQVGSFPAGVYICILKSEKNVYNFRFIKK